MVQIQKFRGTRTLPAPGGIPSAPVDTSAARGLQQVGNAIFDAGATAAELHLQRQKKLDEFKAQSGLIDLTAATNRGLDERIQTMDPGAEGLTKTSLADFDKRSEEFLTGIPQSMKDTAALKVKELRARYEDKFARVEVAESTRYHDDKINQTADDYAVGIRSNPESYESSLSTMNDLIDASPLPTILKEQKKQKLKELFSIAWAESLPAEERAQYFGDGGGREGYFRSIRKSESGGNDNAKNPNSSARGRYQFTTGTWNQVRKNHPDLGLTADGRSDPLQQEKAIRALTSDNAAALARNGISGSNGNLYAAHFLGASGAVSVLKSGKSERIQDIVAPEVIKANPFLRSMTVADFEAWAARKSGGGGQIPDQYKGRVSALSYEDIVKLGDAATKELAATSSLVKDDYRLAIATDPFGLKQGTILADTRLDNGDKASLVNALNAALKDKNDERRAVDIVQSGAEGNPFDSDNRKTADNAYTGISQVQGGNEQAVGEYITEKYGVAPGKYLNTIRNDLNSTDLNTVTSALQQAQRLKSINRGALDGATGGSDVLNAANDFERMTLDHGYTAEQAAQRYLDNRDRVKTVGYDVLLKEGRTLAKDIDNSDIQSALGFGFFSRNVTGAPEVGFDQARNAAIVGDAQEIFVEEYTKTGDQDLSKSRMEGRLRKLYGVSDSFLDAEVITKYPPENFYPPVGGTHDYLRGQVADAVEEITTKKYPDTSVYLMSDMQTARDVAAGQPPRYQIWYVDEKGELARAGAADDYFTPDITKAQNDLKTEITQRRDTTQAARVQGQAAETNPLLGRDMQLQAVRDAARKGLVTDAEKQNIETQIEEAFKEVTTKDEAQAVREEETRRQKQEILDRMLKGLETEGVAR